MIPILFLPSGNVLHELHVILSLFLLFRTSIPSTLLRVGCRASLGGKPLLNQELPCLVFSSLRRLLPCSPLDRFGDVCSSFSFCLLTWRS